MKCLGLIVNPVAGLGGRVGLKGSDGIEIQQQALRLGAEPQAQQRAAEALQVLAPLRNQVVLVTAPGEMGEAIARQCGFAPVVMGPPPPGSTSAEDTRRAAGAMLRHPVDWLLFAGGDGTARDVYSAVGTQVPALGIPAGVKIHSAVFATRPRAAGELAAAAVRGERISLRESEVVDLDEAAYRAGTVGIRLYGTLNVPFRPHLLQDRKVPTPAAEAVRAQAIAAAVIESMQPGWLYVVGPGTTTRAIAEGLGLLKTLVGVDVYRREGVVALDVGEAALLGLVQHQPAKVVVTPIGGQGFLFGRGNQQIGPRVIRQVGRENIVVVSLAEKLMALRGEPLLVDTGDAAVDALLAGYLPVITGYRESVVYRVES